MQRLLVVGGKARKRGLRSQSLTTSGRQATASAAHCELDFDLAIADALLLTLRGVLPGSQFQKVRAGDARREVPTRRANAPASARRNAKRVRIVAQSLQYEHPVRSACEVEPGAIIRGRDAEPLSEFAQLRHGPAHARGANTCWLGRESHRSPVFKGSLVTW